MEAAEARPSLHMSKYHIRRNLMPLLLMYGPPREKTVFEVVGLRRLNSAFSVSKTS